MRNQWLVLTALLALCLVVGALGGWVTAQSVGGWYLTLNRPSWTPPNWIFGPVWTALYVAMAVAAWLVWRSGARPGGAMIVFFAQLALNSAWSFLFFGARSPWLGLVDILFLLVTLALTTLMFFRKSLAAGALMVPYLAWVGFAAALNFTIWRLN